MQSIAGLLFFVWLPFINVTAYAQKYSVIHYDQSNGFPGSYGYQMYQDHNGYIWMSTENGLARFNGYEFKLFTTKDGLPDNEVFDLKEDKNGKLWFTPFATAIAYIKNGKIYNAENNPLLKQLHFRKRPSGFAWDRYGNMYIFEGARIHFISKQGQVDILDSFYLQDSNKNVRGPALPSEDLLVDFKGVVYCIRDRSITYLRSMDTSDVLRNRLEDILKVPDALSFSQKAKATGIHLYHTDEVSTNLNNVGKITPQLIGFARRDGCFIADMQTAHIVDTLLRGYNASPILMTTDGAFWIGTHGSGVFRFVVSPVKTLKLPVEQASVLFIKGQDNGAYALLEKGKFVQISFNGDSSLHLQQVKNLKKKESYDVYVYLGRDSAGNWISCGSRVYKQHAIGHNHFDNSWWGYNKDVVEEDKHTFLVATGLYLVRVDRDNLEVRDTLVRERTTSVAKCGHTIYAGTLNGLLAGTAPGKFSRVFSAVPPLKGHIVKLCAGNDGILWVANNKAELIGVKDNKVIVFRNADDGLQCNRISALRVSSRFIWIGTDNGLYAVKNTGNYPVIRHLTYATGLSSNLVSCLDVQGSNVWVGTAKGINYFNENDVFPQSSGRELLINSIANGGDNIEQRTGTIYLHKKDLAVDFDIIDLTGGQKPSFQYRLDDDSAWISIENSNLYFPSVPYGDFKINIRARSPNWDREKLHTLHFYRSYPFYLRWWFLFLSVLAMLGLIVAGVQLFIRRTRKKDQEKLSIQRSLLQLEQMALQSQMNPHFIFNCISAIKQYFNSGNIEKANDFVDAFALLIRDTFEMGTEPFIPLDKELHYLEQYLTVEQTRFNHLFDFSIEKEVRLSGMLIPVPSMLLQPVVENAVRHGVRHLSDRRGHIKIRVTQENDSVEVIIEDNGVGRERSRSFSQRFRGGVPLTSTTVNARRIDVLNRIFDRKIMYRTEDVAGAGNEIAGTRVIIVYPLSIENL